jgi:hypothetical protein
MQFTYTFPPILRFGYDVITDAMAADRPYVPGNGSQGRVDTWRQWSRWKRVSFIVNQVLLVLNFEFNLFETRGYSVVGGTTNSSMSSYSLAD